VEHLCHFGRLLWLWRRLRLINEGNLPSWVRPLSSTASSSLLRLISGQLPYHVGLHSAVHVGQARALHSRLLEVVAQQQPP
jgi:hypothetical protein